MQRRVLVVLGCLPGTALAHSFGRVYNLPVPLWLYLYGATAALAASFLLAASFISAERSELKPPRDLSRHAPVRALVRLLRGLRPLAPALLLLCMATGFWGNRNPYSNFSMTFFWIVFLLGLTYATACVGNLYGVLNPWRLLSEMLVARWPGYARGGDGCRRYPAWLSDWPALLLFMALIWTELFTHATPHLLASLLLGYTVLNLVAVHVWGVPAWFTHGELFSRYFSLVAKLSPISGRAGRVFWRTPGDGLLDAPPQHLATVVFVLFMLSSTAYDGLHNTAWWTLLFWGDRFGLLTPLLGSAPVYHYASLRPLYLIYESVWLLLSPFLCLGLYALAMAAARRLTGRTLSVRELILHFSCSLLPIALVYHVTHYYTLIFTQGVKIVSQLSDPFGWGWDLFGTAGMWRAPILPDMSTVWHVQVGLIVAGHVASLYIAHRLALQVFGNARQALLSQLPMLVLMMAFTAAGLWLLAQPISGG